MQNVLCRTLIQALHALNKDGLIRRWSYVKVFEGGPTQQCHPERSECFAYAKLYAVEGSVVPIALRY